MSKQSDIRLAGEEARPWEWPEEKWRGIVNRVRAGRSMKPAKWKNDAKVAVALSFDSDHELVICRSRAMLHSVITGASVFFLTVPGLLLIAEGSGGIS